MKSLGKGVEDWLQAQAARPLTWRRRAATAVVASGVMILLRTAVEPIIGSEVSFTVLFPVVILATLAGGAFGGFATILVGSVVALAAAVERDAPHPDAAPRLVVWLLSAVIAAAMSLRLRRAMAALKRHEAELVQAAEHAQMLVLELEHRGRNALTLVEALSQEAARNAVDVDDYRRSLSSRIQALSSGYSFLTRRDPEPILLGALIDDTLSVFWTRIDVADGPLVWLAPNVCVAFALVLHELATNAAKYGALSNAKGRVAIAWRIAEARLSFVWTERNGPVVRRSAHRGFGSRMIQQAFERIPTAAIETTFEADGLICQVTLGYGPDGPSGPAPHAEARPREAALRLDPDAAG